MTKNEIRSVLVSQLKEMDLIPNYEEPKDSHTFEDLGIDSIDVLDLAYQLEKKLGIDQISIDSADTIEESVNYIYNHKQGLAV